MITIRQQGDLSKVNNYFERLKEVIKFGKLDKYGRAGVVALASATPIDTGETASSWSYEIEHADDHASVIFKNSHVTERGVPIAILIQSGHGTGSGAYVQGIDFINPAIRSVFQQMADEVWREVTA